MAAKSEFKKANLELARAIADALALPEPLSSQREPDAKARPLFRYELPGAQHAGFNRLDADGDGRLTPEELRNAIARLPGETRDALAGLVRRVAAQKARERPLKLGLAAMGALVMVVEASLLWRLAYVVNPGPYALLPALLVLAAAVALALALVGAHQSSLLTRRRALARALEEGAREHHLGLEGRALATAIRSLLAPDLRSYALSANPNAGPSFLAGRLGAEAWQQRPLATLVKRPSALPGQLDGLPHEGRLAVGVAIDVATRRIGPARLLYQAACGLGQFALMAAMGAVAGVTGFPSKHHGWVPPNHEFAREYLVGAAVLGLAAAATALVTVLVLRRLRERLAGAVERALEG